MTSKSSRRIHVIERLNFFLDYEYDGSVQALAETMGQPYRKISRFFGPDAVYPKIDFLIDLKHTHQGLDFRWLLSGYPEFLDRNSSFEYMIIERLDQMSKNIDILLKAVDKTPS